MSQDKIIIYGTEWCGDCYRARRILETTNIPFEWVDIDNNQAGENYVLSINNGIRSVPTIVFEDGSVLIEPSNRQLKDKLRILSHTR
jgi:mycoredoxin